MAMALVMLLAPSVFAEENSEDAMIYDDPDHADIQTVVNEESGELYDISSGVTHYEEKNLSNLLSRAAWDGNYADVFYDITSYSKDEQPFNNQSEVKVDLKFKVPATAVGGDTFTFTVSQGYRFHIITSPIYIADANGLVFAKFVAPSWDSATITLTDAVEKFQNIQGSITGLGFSINQPATAGKYALNLISPNGTKLGPGTEYDLAKPDPPVSGIVAGARSYGNDPGYYLAQRFVKSSGKVPGNLNPSQVRSELVLTSSGQKIDCNLLRDENIAFWQWVLPNNLLVQAGKLNVVSCTSTKVVVTPYNAPTAVPSAYVGIRLEIPVITEKEHTSGYAFSAAGYVNNSLVFDGLGTATSGSSNSSEIGGENLAISVDKSASVNSLVIGDHVNYTIVVTADKSNAGTAYNVELADRLPENLQYVSSSDNGVYDSSTHVVNWGGWNYDPGQVRTFTVTTKVLSRPSDGKIVNIALLDGANVCVGNSGGSTNSVCKDDETISVLKPDFDFTKSATIEDTNNNGYIGDKGDNIVYTFNIKNTGETILSTAKFSDPLLGITDRECLSAPLAPGANVNCDGTFTHTIAQDDVDKVNVVNNATMCLDPILGLDCKTGTTTTKTINLSFSFAKDIDKVEDTNENTVVGDAGDTVYYKFSMINTGSVPIESAKLSDDLLGITDVECLSSPLAVGTTAICQGEYPHVITNEEAAAGKVDNTATLTIPNGPSETDDATVPAYKPGVSVLKTSVVEDTNGNGVLGDAGDTIQYSFEITNTGNSILQSVTMTDELLNLKDHECLVEPLAVGDSVDCVASSVDDFSHVITPEEAKSGQVTNNVIVETSGAPPAPGEVTDNVYAPGVSLEKTSIIEDTNEDKVLGNAGDTIKYTFKVTNTGNSILETAKLTDDLLGLKDYECLAEPLVVGESVDCIEQNPDDFAYVITEADGKAGEVKNRAVVMTPGAPPASGDVINETFEPGIALKKLSVVEDTNKDGFSGNAGDTIKYAFKITNTGNSIITTAMLDDEFLKLKDYECLSEPLAVGESINCIEQNAGDFSYVITEADGKAGKVENHAVITTPGAPPAPGEVVDNVYEPGIELEKISSVEDTNKDGVLGNAGDTIKYAFKVTNTGNSIITTAKLDDDLLNLKDYECLAEPLAVGASVNCVEQKSGDFSYVISEADAKAGHVKNDATITTPGAPPAPGEVTDDVYTPGITLEKTSSVEDTNNDTVLGNAGDTIRYTFKITNTGNSVIATAKLNDNLLGLKDYECLAESLNPGESVDCIEQKAGDFSYIITEADGKAGKVENQATVETPGAPPGPAEVIDNVFMPKVELDKQVAEVRDTNGNHVVGDAGDTVVYKFIVKNTGNSVITSALLTDDLLNVKNHQCLVGITQSQSGNAEEGLKPGESAICAGEFTYVISDDDVLAGKVHNTATIAVPGAPEASAEVDVKTNMLPVTIDKGISKGAVTGQALLQGNVWLIVIGSVVIGGAIIGLVAINKKRN